MKTADLTSLGAFTLMTDSLNALLRGDSLPCKREELMAAINIVFNVCRDKEIEKL